MSWIQSLDFVTQSAHFFAGIAVPSLAALWMPWWVAGILFVILWAAPKELVFDKVAWGEGHGSCDWLDFTFYCIGDVVFALCHFLSKGV